MRKIPRFTRQGLLPAGDFEATIDEIQSSILIRGKGEGKTWDATWRFELTQNLAVLVKQLWRVGITEIFINGSFVERCDHPNDIDGYFECSFDEYLIGDLERKLNALNSHRIWTWAPEKRRLYRGYGKLQLPMWHQYRVELFPHFGFGPDTGIVNDSGLELLFPAAFRQSRTGIPKGIIKIRRS